MVLYELEEHLTWHNGLPAKRVSAGALIFNIKNQLLVFKPNYQEKWVLPGGVVEAGEAPLEGLIREIKEEMGLSLNYLKFASVEYQAPQGEYLDFLHFVFNAGVINQTQIDQIKLQEEELIEYKFVDVAEVDNYLDNFTSRRVMAAIKASPTPVYSEGGKFANEIYKGVQVTEMVDTAAGVFVFNKQDQILLIQEGTGPVIGQWHFPAGKIDIGENFVETAVREAKEEAGIDISVDESQQFLYFDGLKKSSVAIFPVVDFEGDIEIDGHEIIDYKWVKIGELFNSGLHLRKPKILKAALTYFKDQGII